MIHSTAPKSRPLGRGKRRRSVSTLSILRPLGRRVEGLIFGWKFSVCRVDWKECKGRVHGRGYCSIATRKDKAHVTSTCGYNCGVFTKVSTVKCAQHRTLRGVSTWRGKDGIACPPKAGRVPIKNIGIRAHGVYSDECRGRSRTTLGEMP